MSYEIRSLRCSHCEKKLVHGFRRFGPQTVRCSYCGSVMRTGLNSWHDPWGAFYESRPWYVFAELLVPSWIRVPGGMGFVLHIFIFCFYGIIASLPLVALGGGVSPHPAWLSVAAPVLCMVIWVCYPISQIARLFLMVREARYCDSHLDFIPTWPHRATRT